MNYKKLRRTVGYGSIGLMALLVLAMLFPVTRDSHAITEDEFSGSVHTDIKSYVRSTIALAISGQVSLDLTPKSNGVFSEATAKLSVATNNVSGYSVYLAMVDDSSNSLLPMNTRDTKEIKATPATLTAENYANYLNTWGYKVVGDSNAGYQAVPKTAGAPIITEGSNSKEMEYDLAFAVAAGRDLPAGVYGNQVLVSAVANPIEVRGINDITFMQEMTADICTVSFEGETKQLIDNRDGKSYWVAKLKDGNCWMVQDLALGLDTNEAGNAIAIAEDGKSRELNETNTDIAGKWNQQAPTKTETDIPLPNTTDSGEIRSWDLGRIVLTSPTGSQLCPTQNPTTAGVVGQTYPSSDQYNSAFTGQSIADTCSQYYQDVSSGWTAGYSATETSSIDETNKTYDAHYLIGNYYQYGTATAGTGIGLSGTNATNANGNGLTNATSSICPKGWRLPKAGRNISATDTVFGVGPGQSYNINGSFYGLLSKYGYDTDWNANNGNGYMLITTGVRRLDYGPLYFLRSGGVRPFYGALRNVGMNGFIWSSTTYPSDRNEAYRLGFDNSRVYPSNYDFRYEGFPVRCVAK